MENIIEFLNKGNLVYQWKVMNGQESIPNNQKIPKFPILILTCMDPRIDPYRIFQLEPGDVYVLRNAGNILTKDVMRALLLAIYESKIKNIVILGHLDCKMAKININTLKEKLPEHFILTVAQDMKNPYYDLSLYFRNFKDELKNLKDQASVLKNSRFIPSDVEIIPILYDVNTGWVFDVDLIKQHDSMESFMRIYKDVLKSKRSELENYLLSENLTKESKIQQEENAFTVGSQEETNQNIEYQTQTRKTVISESPLQTFQKTFNSISNIIPKIHVQKIITPKIKISIPAIHRSKVLMNDKKVFKTNVTRKTSK